MKFVFTLNDIDIRNIEEKYNIRLVSNIETIETKPSFEALAWYFGKTKIKKNDYVIQGIVSESCKFLKIIVSCDNEKDLTGFLSELGNDLRKDLLRTNIINDEDEIICLRCPTCAAPLPRCPRQGESNTCAYCNYNFLIDEMK